MWYPVFSSHMKTSFNDLTGRRFGRWVVIKRTPRSAGEKPGQTKWLCVCDCGKTKPKVQYASLVKGHSQSCGCLRKDLVFKPDNEVRSKRNPLYGVWISMRARCHNPNNPAYKYYGLRGIKVCQRWLDGFNNFVEDMGARPSTNHSIERKDTDGHYSPENCVWETDEVQASNRRYCKKHSWKGSDLTTTQIARMENVEYSELIRLVHGLGVGMVDAVAKVKMKGRHFQERAKCLGAPSKNSQVCDHRVVKGGFIISKPGFALAPVDDPLADIW